jgi:hypothetical protein
LQVARAVQRSHVAAVLFKSSERKICMRSAISWEGECGPQGSTKLHNCNGGLNSLGKHLAKISCRLDSQSGRQWWLVAAEEQ